MNKRYSIIGLVFSKDRALQLQATIESFLLHCSEDVEICVLYKATNELHQEQYENLQAKFPDISFVSSAERSSTIGFNK